MLGFAESYINHTLQRRDPGGLLSTRIIWWSPSSPFCTQSSTLLPCTFIYHPNAFLVDQSHPSCFGIEQREILDDTRSAKPTKFIVHVHYIRVHCGIKVSYALLVEFAFLSLLILLRFATYFQSTHMHVYQANRPQSRTIQIRTSSTLVVLSTLQNVSADRLLPCYS
jgi:hypothetical protein